MTTLESGYVLDGMNEFERNVKRMLDFCVALVCLVIFSPLFLICYIAIKREDNGPAIFKQERIGRFGRPFTMYKFRSMRTDAEKDSPEAPHVVLTELGEAVKREWLDVSKHHPEVSSIAVQMMPDHLHGILFVHEQMQQHLGHIIKGFKASTNKHYRQLCYAATPSLQRKPGEKRDRSLDDREHGMLWSLGYNDHILSGKGELQR